MFNEDDWKRFPDYPQGYVGPVGLDGTEIIADWGLDGAGGMATGANEVDYHVINVEVGRDFTVDRFADLVKARAGDPCPKCRGELAVEAGIEVGQVFQLGTRYSAPMGCCYDDERGETRPMVMGTYGIGVSRLMAAVVEQSHDEKGMIWPLSVAPALAHIIPLNYEKEERREVAERLYRQCLERGWAVLLDDREESAGVKFADSDLIGIPYRVVIGKGYDADGRLELQVRATGERMNMEMEALLGYLEKELQSVSSS
jgi:prolyl-tRNA synthetase